MDRVSGFPTNGIVVETADRYFTSGVGGNWEEALKVAWTDMVGLISYLYDTTAEYANLIVGTIGDAIPGYAAGTLNSQGFPSKGTVTCQIAITKDLRRTGESYRV